jgi:hypothetical protein
MPFPPPPPAIQEQESPYRRHPYRYRKRPFSVYDISQERIAIIAEDIANKNLSAHQRQRYNYNNTGRVDIETLSKAIHLNHSTELHNNIIKNYGELTYANLFFGSKVVRIQSDGGIMVIVLSCSNPPKKLKPPSGWNVSLGKDKITLYTTGDSLISGEVDLFRYNTHLRISGAQLIGSNGVKINPVIKIEGVDYWPFLKGNWETMDGADWTRYKGEF